MALPEVAPRVFQCLLEERFRGIDPSRFGDRLMKGVNTDDAGADVETSGFAERDKAALSRACTESDFALAAVAGDSFTSIYHGSPGPSGGSRDAAFPGTRSGAAAAYLDCSIAQRRPWCRLPRHRFFVPRRRTRHCAAVQTAPR